MDDLPIELLNSNSPPTNLQIDQVRKLILERREQAHDLQSRYAITQAVLADIAFRQKAAEQDLTLLNKLLSPVRRIPSEILAEIFQYCLEHSRSSGPHHLIDDPRVAPILLSHVCAFWRSVAVNTPRLWDRPTFIFKSAHQTVPILHNIVERSSPHLIAVGIRRDSQATQHRTPRDILTALTTVSGFIDRVKRLQLELVIPGFDDLLGLFPPLFPCLHRLTLDAASRTLRQPIPAGVLEFFGRSPSLSELFIHAESSILTDSIVPRFPWVQLTDLHISTRLDLFSARSILARCTNLRSCSFTALISNNIPRPVVNPPTTVLRELHKLTVRRSMRGLHTSHAFFDIFVLPYLRHLDIDLFNWPRGGPLSLQQRSKFTLTCLTLRDIDADFGTTIAFLQRSPTIAELRLHNFSDQGIITALACPPSHIPVLLPHLTRLAIEMPFSDAFVEDGEELLEMLESRWDLALRPQSLPAFARLQHVDLRIGGDPFSFDVEERIRHLVSVGVLNDHTERC
ncbi:hypothetical protein C8R43DRAFT_1140971 [Mycena crocata]|nr:hypothetical protein C8R43DRAFT_1140971 [Mycena crocata]